MSHYMAIAGQAKCKTYATQLRASAERDESKRRRRESYAAVRMSPGGDGQHRRTFPILHQVEKHAGFSLARSAKLRR